MAQKWDVIVKDHQGDPITGAKVAFHLESDLASFPIPFPFDLASTTHHHVGNGRYEENQPMTGDLTGDWALIVNRAGKSPVIQPVTLSQATPGPLALFDTKPKGGEAETVDISDPTSGSLPPTTIFTVTMHPDSEVVFVCGTEFQNFGTPMRTYAEGRRFQLLQAKRTDVGTMVTIFSLDDRAMQQFVKAKGPDKWLLLNVDKKPQPPPMPIIPGQAWPFPPNATHNDVAISITNVYKYLHEIGSESRKQRVREVSFFSHSFGLGPILYNTFDHSGTQARDPDDFDARSKDFRNPNFPNWDKLPDAMASGSSWHIWGCNSWPRVVVMAGGAENSRNKGRPPDEFFVLQRKRVDGGNEEERINRVGVEDFIGRVMVRGTFMSAAAEKLPGVRVIGPATGMWANLSKKGRRFFIEKKKDNSFTVMKDFYSKNPVFSSAFNLTTGIDGDGYTDYQNYMGISLPSVALSSKRYFFLNHGKGSGKRSDISFNRFGPLGEIGFATLEKKEIADAGSLQNSPAELSGKKGDLYILRRVPAGHTRACLVLIDGSDERVFQVSEDVSGTFNVFDSELVL